ncbi:Imm8 family immunity protein [Listeria welshimeri]|uniref:Immunity protein 8 n=1 Tax=Listeria welshimeri TaxID=1643 RepID=A0ABX4IFR0_LISWE|nr:Imm8 family immunity protein [Listeria welshimeri]MBC1242894.1 hypothetical protein [Listeria welshimeri]MBC1354721.1 hypothetical protein [Listeria welshimeri]MBC1403279.1 hypothetical protein [Listeria welshimeri]MBC1409595.1 hypothetical protein [Listeria welshimeri]MBC1465386.1 hypothetical protein [Listeria welshimeri]
MKNQNRLELVLLQEIHSTKLNRPLKDWEPSPKEEIYMVVDMFIGTNDTEKGGNYFNVLVVTPEALYKSKHLPKEKRKFIVLENYSYDLLLSKIETILQKCSKNNWEDSCQALQNYFCWEFENYKG